MTPERKPEFEVKRFGAIAATLHEALEPALKFLDRCAGCDITKETAADDPIFRHPRHPRFVGVILEDRAVGIDGDKAEGQQIDLSFGKIEDSLRHHLHTGAAFASKVPRAPGTEG